MHEAESQASFLLFLLLLLRRVGVVLQHSRETRGYGKETTLTQSSTSLILVLFFAGGGVQLLLLLGRGRALEAALEPAPKGFTGAGSLGFFLAGPRRLSARLGLVLQF